MTAETAQSLIQDALEGIGVYAPGETVATADLNRCLVILNDMMDIWSNESLMSYANTEQSGLLVPGIHVYTIGVGGDFNLTRPIRILDSPGTCYSVDQNGNRYNIQVVTQDRWNLIWNVTQTNSNYPEVLFYDPQFPLGIINVYPVPTTGYTLFFDSRIQLSELTALATSLSLPPGYSKAIKDNLRVQFWPYFKPDGSVPPASTVAMAANSKGIIKRSNVTPNYANFDPELVSRGGGYNVYSDGRAGSSG